MSKQVGFKLVFDGTQTSINEMRNVETALEDVSKKITLVKTESKGILEPLIKSQTTLQQILLSINKLLIEQNNNLKSSKIGKTFDETVIQRYTDKIKVLKEEILRLQNDLKNKPVNVVNLDGTKEKIEASIIEVKKLAPALDSIAKGGANNLFNKIAEIDARLKIVNIELKASQKNDSPANTENTAQLLAQQKALIAEKKLLNQESINLTNQLTKEARAYDPTSIIGMRLELSKLEKEYINLSEEARNSAAGIEKFNKLSSLSATVNAEEQKIGIFKRNVGNYRDAVNGLIPTLQKLSSAGLVSQKELLNLFKAENKTKVDALQKEVEQLSAAFLKLSAAEKQAANGQQLFAQLNNKINEVGNTAIDTNSKISTLGKGALSIGNVITGGLIGGGLVVGVQSAFAGIKKAIDISAEITDVQANVRKTTELTTEQVKQLTNSFKNIDTRTSTKGLFEIAAVAGQLGVTGVKGVEEFTKAINVVAVALGDDLQGGVEQIANDMSKLSNVLFGATTDGTKLAENISYLGNTLNVLAASGAATGEKMLDFGTRIGGTLVPLGATAAQVLALSATFDSLNINPEKGATAINNLIKDLGANTKLFSETLNLSQQQLKDAYNTDPLEAFNIVLKQINTISGGDKTKSLELLKELKQTGEGVSTVFFQMSTNQSLYNNYLEQSTKAIKESTSLTKEYDVVNNNLAGTIDKISKRIADFSSSEGLIQFFEVGGKAVLAFISKIETVGTFLGLLSKQFVALKQGFLLSTDFSDVDANIKKLFSPELSKEFEEGKYKSQAAELALKLAEVRKNNQLVNQEISKAQNLINNANYNLKFNLNEFELNKQKEIIKRQNELILNAKSRIVNEQAFAQNFIQSVAFTPDKDKTAQELEADAAKNKLAQDKINADAIEAEKEKNKELIKQAKERSEKLAKLQKEENETLLNLRRKLEVLKIGNISEQFKREFEKINNDAKVQIEDLQAQLVLKPVTTKQIEKNSLINKSIEEIKTLQKTQIDVLNAKEAEAIQAATNNLINIKNEINNIILSGAEISIKSNIDQAQFELKTITQDIEIKYTINEDKLKEQLANGTITQKEYDELISKNTRSRLSEQLEAQQNYVDSVIGLYDILKEQEIQLLELKYKTTLETIKQKAITDKAKINADNPQGLNETQQNTIIAIDDKANEEAIKAALELQAEKEKIEQQNIENKKQATDEIIKITRSATDIEIDEAKKVRDQKIQFLEDVKQKTEDLAREAIATVYEIEARRADDKLAKDEADLEAQQKRRLELVKGNTAEEEKINAEFDEKKQKLRKQNFEDDKRRSIAEATIMGVLALMKIASDRSITIQQKLVLGFIQAGQTALQIAKIKSAKFAEGGKHSDVFRKSGEGGKTGTSTLPKDSTGKRPVGIATFHEDEYTMPEIQTKNNTDIVDIFEENRKALLAGRKTDLRKNLLNALIRSEKLENKITSVKQNAFPTLYQRNYFSATSNGISIIDDKSIETLTNKISLGIKEAIADGTKAGYENAVKEVIKNNIRNENLILQKAK